MSQTMMNIIILIITFSKVNSVPLIELVHAAHTGILSTQVPGAVRFDNYYFIPLQYEEPAALSSYLGTIPEDIKKTPFWKTFQSIMTDWMNEPDYLQTQFESSPQRSRRFLDHGLLPFIGWIQQKLTGVSLTSDLDDLRVQSTELSDHVTQIKTILESNLQRTSSIIHDIETLQVQQDDIASQFNKLIIDFVQIGNIVNATRDEMKATELAILGLVGVIKFIRHKDHIKDHYDEVFQSCSSERLSYKLFPIEQLQLLYSKWKWSLKAVNLFPVITDQLLHTIYRLPLISCELSYPKIHMMLSLPIRYNPVPSKFVQIRPLPLRIHNELHELLTAAVTLWMLDGDQWVAVNDYDSVCPSDNSKSLSNCFIRPMRYSHPSPDSCDFYLWKGGAVKSLQNSCKYRLITDTHLEWIKHNTTTWIYTGSEIAASLVVNKANTTIKIGDNHSISMITLPCSAQLITPSVHLISSAQCLQHPTTLIYKLHALVYLPISELLLSGLESAPIFPFDPSLLKINTSIRIHDYKDSLIGLQKDIDYLKTHKTPTIDWTSPYHSLWYYIISSIIIIVLITSLCGSLIYYRSRKISAKEILSRAPLLLAPSPVTSETDIPVFADVFIILLACIILLVLIILIYKEVRIIRSHLSCHEFHTTLIPIVPGHHVDGAFQYLGTTVSIAIKPLNLPSQAYRLYMGNGFIEHKFGHLYISDAPILEDYLGSQIDINGVYKCSQLAEFPKTALFIKTT